jgi:hypothetical protein
MKKVRVFECSIPDLDNDYATEDAKRDMELWLKTDDGKFCVKESKTKLEIVEDFTDLYYHKRIRIFAEFDEKIETFWRLKFK